MELVQAKANEAGDQEHVNSKLRLHMTLKGVGSGVDEPTATRVWTTTYAARPRTVHFLASSGTLLDAGGAFQFAGYQADGCSFVPTAVEQGTAVLNPGGVGRTVTSTGLAGVLEFVTDLQSGGVQTPLAKRKALRLVTAATHYNTSNHARNQFTTPPLAPYTHYRNKISLRWDTTNTAAANQPAKSYYPMMDRLQDCILFQIHQYRSDQPWETLQVAGVNPPITFQFLDGRYGIRINVLNEILGNTVNNAAGKPYRSFDLDDVQTGYTYWADPQSPNDYIDLTFEYFLDPRQISEGGKGYFRARAGGVLFCDYFGPTLHPQRGEDKVDRIVEVASKFGCYFYNSPYDLTVTNTIETSILESANVYNPFKTVALLVREFSMLVV